MVHGLIFIETVRGPFLVKDDTKANFDNFVV